MEGFCMKKFKFAWIILCAAIILAVLSACGNSENENNNNPTAAVDDESSDGEVGEAAVEADPDAPDLPQIDMGGRVFTIFTAGWGGDTHLYPDLSAEEQTGEAIQDAAFERRIRIEDRFNVQLRHIYELDPHEAVNRYRTLVLAGDDSYDFAITNLTNFSTLLMGNYLIEFNDMPHMDLNKPYWDQNFNDSLAILGKRFGISGDISMRRLQCVWIMCFNKELIENHNMESPFELVKNGEWTYFKMHEMGREVARDLNGDGLMTREDDLWGINYTGDTIMGIINSAGVRIAELDAEGIPHLTIEVEPNLSRLQTIFTDMRDNSYAIDTLFVVGGGVSGMPDAQIFSENRALFLACATHNVSQIRAGDQADIGLRTMDVDFGIIPYPKWDTTQDGYKSYTAGNYHPVISVPVTNSNLEHTGIIMEALAYEGMRTIIPEFYESLLKTKTARDEESAEMLDYIFGNIHYDIGNMLNFGGIAGVFGWDMSTNPRADIVSIVERQAHRWQQSIDDLVEQIRMAGN
jgi:hypothetical protein